MDKFFKIVLIAIIAGALAGGFSWWMRNDQNSKAVLEEKKDAAVIGNVQENKIEAVEEDKSGEEGAVGAPEKEVRKNEEKMANKILIEVPFSSQAPLGKWDAYHEEACEETSLIMVKYYLDRKKLTPEIAEKEIQALIAYQIRKNGKYEDSTAKELVEMAKDFYGIENLKVIYDFEKAELKRYLSLGNPIIVPAAGRLLGNPNFKSPGPLYHNLVLTGFDGDKIITNDPGTRKGQGYQYDIDVLYNAIHDFPGDLKNMEKGKKAMIVVE